MRRALSLLAATMCAAACSSAPRAPELRLSAEGAQEAPAPPAAAPGGDADLAKKLSNPVAELISVPLQLNYDQDIGPGDEGERWQLNIQPVVPLTLNEDWNVISRTILPVLAQSDVPPGEDESGLGDITQSLFFSPKTPTAAGWVWGAGPAFLIPTATDDTLGTEKWGAGPTAVALRQQGSLTYGALANHIWSFAGDDDRAEVSSTLLQPFLAHTTPSAWTFTLNSEATYDWRASDWGVPLNAVVSKVVRIGGLPLSLVAGGRYWLEQTEGGPEGFGLRFGLTFVFPK